MTSSLSILNFIILFSAFSRTPGLTDSANSVKASSSHVMTKAKSQTDRNREQSFTTYLNINLPNITQTQRINAPRFQNYVDKNEFIYQD
jgi:hypothetical protein